MSPDSPSQPTPPTPPTPGQPLAPQPSVDPQAIAPAPAAPVADSAQAVPQAPVAPLAPQLPTEPMPAIGGQVPGMVATAPVTAGGATSGKKTGLIIGIIVAAIAVLTVLVFFVVLPLLSGDANKSRSNAFMDKVVAGDTGGAITFVNEPDQEDKDFVTSFVNQVKGSKVKLKESTTKDGTFYALYELSGTKYTSARTHLNEVSGTWYVNGMFWGEQPLALIPGQSGASTPGSSAPPNASAPAPAASAGTCLVQSDYKWMTYNKEEISVTYDTTYDPEKHTFNRTDSMFFRPDSTNEDSFTSIYDDWTDFAKRTQDKQWKFRLQGSTFGSDSAAASSKKLANDRSEKVKAELVKRGVPAERIIIEAPYDYSNEEQDALDDIYRRVQVTVDPTCTGSAASGSGGR